MIFVADYLNRKIYRNDIPKIDKSKGERIFFDFGKEDEGLIFDGNYFYFKDKNLGEIFSDDFSSAVNDFGRIFSLSDFFSKEKLEELGFFVESYFD